RNVFYQGGNAALTTNTGTALLLYRVLEAPTQYGDLGVGFRAWGFSSNLTLNPGILPGANVNRSAGWVDPLIGGRYHIELPNGFDLLDHRPAPCAGRARAYIRVIMSITKLHFYDRYASKRPCREFRCQFPCRPPQIPLPASSAKCCQEFDLLDFSTFRGSFL